MRCLIPLAVIIGALPQCTLDRPCPVGTIAPTEDAAIRSAAATGCPLVAFVHQPARAVAGSVSYRADPPDVTGPRTWAGSATRGVYLAADATDAELLATAARYLPRRLPVGPAQWLGCPGGRCRQP
jgi:hypothetical protein